MKILTTETIHNRDYVELGTVIGKTTASPEELLTDGIAFPINYETQPNLDKNDIYDEAWNRMNDDERKEIFRDLPVPFDQVQNRLSEELRKEAYMCFCGTQTKYVLGIPTKVVWDILTEDEKYQVFKENENIIAEHIVFSNSEKDNLQNINIQNDKHFQVTQIMISEAEKMSADAIIGVKYSTTAIDSIWDGGIRRLQIMVYGTAIKFI